MDKIKVACEMEVTLNIIGGKFKPLILHLLIDDGTKRFSEIKSFINNISQKTLTNQLRELEKEGLIFREVYPTVPPKVEYSITEKGKTLIPVLDAMCKWGESNINDNYELLNPLCSEKSMDK